MGLFLGMGKALAVLFWGAVLFNLLSPLAQPFAGLLDLAALTLFGLHVVQMLWATNRPQGPGALGWRLQILLFGSFHLYGRAVTAAAVDEPALEVGHA